jgi:hypothetical protein
VVRWIDKRAGVLRLSNRVDSEGQIAAFIERYNYRRFRENLESQSG